MSFCLFICLEFIDNLWAEKYIVNFHVCSFSSICNWHLHKIFKHPDSVKRITSLTQPIIIYAIDRICLVYVFVSMFSAKVCTLLNANKMCTIYKMIKRKYLVSELLR